jgi:hypothetical protein
MGCDGVPNSGLVYDACGECGGNNSKCMHEWCDPTIPFSKLDACGVCNGNNNTCMCVEYKTYNLAQMDCLLLNYTFTNTITYIDQLLTTLSETRDGISTTPMGDLNDVIGGEIRLLNQFTDVCVDQLCKELTQLLEKLV